MTPAPKKKANNQSKQLRSPPGVPQPVPMARAKPHNRGSNGPGSALARYDARSSNHLPGPRSCAPYTVVKERVTFYEKSNTSGQNVVTLIGPFVQGTHGSSGGEHLSSAVAVTGVGTNVPGVTEVAQVSRLFNGVSPQTKSCSLHSLHMEVTCTGSASGVLPTGNVWAGAVTQPLNRLAGWTNWNSIADGLQTRRNLRMFSAYETMTKPISVCSYPLDAVAHSEFLWMSGSYALSDELYRAMTPIVIVFGPTTATNDYTVSLTIEWRMREAVDPFLQSTHKHYMPASESVWSQLSAHLSNVGGFIKSVGGDSGVQAAVRGAITAGARYAPRALALMQ